MTPSSCSQHFVRHIAHDSQESPACQKAESRLDKDASPEQKRYRVLLEITDLVARAKSLPEAFKEIAAPALALTGGELLNVSLHDPRRDRMLTHYWKKKQRVESPGSPVDEAATGRAWNIRNWLPFPIPSARSALAACPYCSITACDQTGSSHEHAGEHLGAIGLGKSVAEEVLMLRTWNSSRGRAAWQRSRWKGARQPRL